jgi:hypothetical protein
MNELRFATHCSLAWTSSLGACPILLHQHARPLTNRLAPPARLLPGQSLDISSFVCPLVPARLPASTPINLIADTESYPDLQQSYGAYNVLTELEIRTVQVLSRPYNQGTYCRCAGLARMPLTVGLVSCSNNPVPI